MKLSAVGVDPFGYGAATCCLDIAGVVDMSIITSMITEQRLGS